MKTSCPYCGQHYEVDENFSGETVNCQQCGKAFVIQQIDQSCSQNNNANTNVVESQKTAGVKQQAENAFRKTFKLDKLEGFSLSKIMRQVFKRHPWSEIEDYMSLGTPKNTPSLVDVETKWPAPWLFLRAMLLSIGLYLFIIWRADFFGEFIVLPLLLIGVIGIPFASLLFFWEVNVPRNVSVISFARIMVISGFVSAGITLLIHKYITSPENAIWAGPIEETAKLLTMLFFIRNKAYKFKLNGLLIGAAVGAGFAIIETGGYTLRYESGTMELRALLSPFMHIPWSAIVGFALWRSKGQKSFAVSDLFSPKFIPLFLLSIGLHMFWNSKLLVDERLIKYGIVAAIEYIVIIYLIQEGINEVRRIKAEMVRNEQSSYGDCV